jgi:hypothetical protein
MASRAWRKGRERAMARAAILVLLVSLAVPAAPAGEGFLPSEAARRALDALVRSPRHRIPLTGPSLTRCVADLVACGDADVRAVLAEFWDLARVERSPAWFDAEDVETIVRLLYVLPGSETEAPEPFRIREGTVLWYEPDSEICFVGPVRPYRPDLPPLADLLAGRLLRPVPAPSAARLLALVEQGEPGAWSRSERWGFHAALGEAAAGEPEVAAALVKRFAAASLDEYLALAIGQADTPLCRQALHDRLLDTARRLAAGSIPEEEQGLLAWGEQFVADLLAEKAPEMARASLAGAEGPIRERLLSLFWRPCGVPLLLDAIDAAKSKEERVAAVTALADAVLARHRALPAVKDVERFLETCLSCAPDLPEVERSKLWWAVESLFFGWHRYPPRSPFDDFWKRVWKSSGPPKSLISIEPCPDMETIAGRLVEDLAAGRLGFLEGYDVPSIFSPRTLTLGSGVWEWEAYPAHSPIAPFDGWAESPEGFPVFAAAEWTPEGLRITLRNVGKDPFVLGPHLGRYAMARVARVCLKRGATLVGQRLLTLELGSFPFREIATRREDLVRLDPGRSYAWTQAVPPDHRDVERIAISIGDRDCHGFRVIGGSDVPVLTRLETTLIR